MINKALHAKPFDPYPYILLNLFLSMMAGVQAAALLIVAKRSDSVASEIVIHTEKNTEELKDLVHDNTALTAEVKRNTDLLEEIHRHVAALSPSAGLFPPEQEPPFHPCGLALATRVQPRDDQCFFTAAQRTRCTRCPVCVGAHLDQ